MLYPLKFEHIYKENVWGGSLMKEVLNRDIPSEHTGESWDIACHEHGTSIVRNGPLKGKSLDEIYQLYKEELIGCDKLTEKFPLLIKIIDANKRLSLQVHPNDLYAKLIESGDAGKSEMWYVIQAEEDAKITIGLRDGVTKDQFIEAMLNEDLSSCIYELPVQAGDIINIPSGLIHAIQEGIMIAEVQQNSDTVYRVYDWDRLDLDGNKRALHLEKALGCIHFEDQYNKKAVLGLEVKDDIKKKVYIANEHFAIEKNYLDSYYLNTSDYNKMVIYMCLEGSYEIHWQEMITEVKKGESLLLPACLGEYELKGNAELLKVYIPDVKKDVIEPLINSGYSKEIIESHIEMV